MEKKYYVLSLNNNIYAVCENGKMFNERFRHVFDANDKVSGCCYIPGLSDGTVLGEEIDGHMYDFFTGDEVDFIPRNNDSVSNNNYGEVNSPSLSYYAKREICASLMYAILSRYKTKNVTRYFKMITSIKDRNARLYSNLKKINDTDYICSIKDVPDYMEYVSEFKKRIRNVKAKKR